MILYATSHSPRLQYIISFAAAHLSKEGIQFTTDPEVFLHHDGPRINYSAHRICADELQVIPHTLLFEKGIHAQDTGCFKWNDRPAFFKTGGDIPFDVFAAAFYLISRYEEYLPHRLDMYGRYAHENALAFREGFLDLPLADHWMQDLRHALQQRFPAFEPIESVFSFLPTYDIDEAYAYKHKGWVRTSGARLKAWLRGDLRDRLDRTAVLEGKQADPFDSYDWMDALHDTYQLKPRYFFLLPEKTGKYDRNILPSKPALQALLRRHAEKYETGIHPSWQSGDDPALLKSEIARFASVTGFQPAISRQHFIRFTLPGTFRRLIDAGIKEDHSMGYGTINGFRASVSTAYHWYDLEREEATALLLHPYCFMEANAFFEQKMGPVDALYEMRRYETAVREVNGTFSCIWHNTFLGNFPVYAGWRDVYEAFIRTRG